MLSSYSILGSGLFSPPLAVFPTLANAQPDLQTTKSRNLVIDLGNGVKTNAQLTLPAVGQGPYPGVLLIQRSGAIDMNETLGFIGIDDKTGPKNTHPVNHPFK